MVSATHYLSIYSKKEIEYLKKTHEQNNLTLLKQRRGKGVINGLGIMRVLCTFMGERVPQAGGRMP